MHRRHFIGKTALLSSAGLLGGFSSFASLFRQQTFNIRMLRNNIGIFTERGGTIGFMLSKEGILVIDAQFADTAPHLIAELQKQSSQPFKFLLNTHHHRDHTEGNIAFKGLAEHVVAHQNAAANQKAVAEKAKTIDKQLFPDQTFTEDVKLKIGNEKIKGYYFGAAHTNGDAVYHFQNSNVFHVGDLMFYKRHPVIDRSAGASITNWVQVLEKIRKTASKDSIIIFGHALNAGEETGNRDDLKKFSDYLQKLLQFTEAEIKKGVTKEEFKKNTAIPGVTEWSGTGIDRPLTAAYEELSEKKNI